VARPDWAIGALLFPAVAAGKSRSDAEGREGLADRRERRDMRRFKQIYACNGGYVLGKSAALT
jgi:hypothetical protein